MEAAVVGPPTAFDAFIIQYEDHLPWQESDFTAVLPEFRFFEAPLIFSINNIMNNLPVHGRVQVVGGPAVCDGMRRLFPVEVAAVKVVLTDVGDRHPDHNQISQFLTDLDDVSAGCWATRGSSSTKVKGAHHD